MKTNRKIALNNNIATSTDNNRINNLPEAESVSTTATTMKDLLSGGGEMGERIRAFDWSMTPLRPITSWSTALLTTVRILLANCFPILQRSGPDYISIDNDAYIPILGKNIPAPWESP